MGKEKKNRENQDVHFCNAFLFTLSVPDKDAETQT